jgi:hypothetical protein
MSRWLSEEVDHEENSDDYDEQEAEEIKNLNSMNLEIYSEKETLKTHKKIKKNSKKKQKEEEEEEVELDPEIQKKSALFKKFADMSFSPLVKTKMAKVSPDMAAMVNAVRFKPCSLKVGNWDTQTLEIPYLKRKYFAHCKMETSDTIFIFGGENEEKEPLNDLIFYDEKEWFAMDFTGEFHPPPLNNPFMFIKEKNLILMDCQSLKEYYVLIDYKSNSRHWERQYADINFGFNVKHVTAIEKHGYIYIFGGLVEDEDKVSNNMIILKYYNGLKKINVNIKYLPEGRYNYSCVELNDNIYYFGGQNGTKQFQNLFFYSINAQFFKDIDLDQIFPVFQSSNLFCNYWNDGVIYLQGNRLESSKIQSSFYEIDVNDFKVNLLQNFSDVNICDEKIISLNEKTLLLGGSVNDYQSFSENGIVLFQNRNEIPNVLQSLIAHFKEMIETKTVVDYTFEIQGKDDFLSFPVHKCFIYSRCDYLKSIIENETQIQNIDPIVFKKYLGNLKSFLSFRFLIFWRFSVNWSNSNQRNVKINKKLKKATF